MDQEGKMEREKKGLSNKEKSYLAVKVFPNEMLHIQVGPHRSLDIFLLSVKVLSSGCHELRKLNYCRK